MSGLKEVRNRITSVGSTMQITSAMKMVSAAKLRRAQDAIVQMRPYAEKMKEILGNLSSSLDTSDGIYSAVRDGNTNLFVAITSNRGLCGGFNNNVIKRVNQLAYEEYKGQNNSVLSIGKKADDFFKGTELNIKGSRLLKKYNYIWDDLNYEKCSEIAETLMKVYIEAGVDRVILVYNSFKNAAVQELKTEQFLPVQPPEADEDNNFSKDYIFEPTKEEIVEDLIPRSIKTQLYKALLDSHASEHGARMTAMHKATDNAGDMLKELKLHYNKARQAAITAEILEIVGGAEALNS